MMPKVRIKTTWEWRCWYPKKAFDSFITTPNANTDVQNTYAVAFKTSNDPVTYRFCAGWQPSDPQFASEAAFRQFLLQEIKRSSPDQPIMEIDTYKKPRFLAGPL